MCYFHKALAPNDRSNFLKALDLFLKERDRKPELILARGMSGAVMAGAAAAMLGIQIAIVRKKGEKTHSCMHIESCVDLSQIGKLRFIVIDDLIETGETIKAIIDDWQQYVKSMFADYDVTKCCDGIFLYNARGTYKGGSETKSFLRRFSLQSFNNGNFTAYQFET